VLREAGSAAFLSYVKRRTLISGVDIMPQLDWARCAAVESVAGKLGGVWVLAGTRMPVSSIFENIEAGANIDELVDWFDGLDREQVKQVIRFAASSLEMSPAMA
jgi:uncharacterized protein (DUF433 family)